MVFHTHSHGDSGHHDHHHEPRTTYDRAFFLAMLFNGLFVLIQIFYAFYANSTSLLADAVHNMGDVLSLGLSWVAFWLMQKHPTEQATFGFKKSTIIVASMNSLLLFFSSGFIVSEVINQWLHHDIVYPIPVMIVSMLGMVINAGTALLFVQGQADLNIKSAFLHLLYDALISFGVVLSAIVIYYTGWHMIDPLVGLFIALIILTGTWSLMRECFRLLMDGVPSSISYRDVVGEMKKLSSVLSVHDVHIWAISTQENALSAHVLVSDRTHFDAEWRLVVRILKEKYKLTHITIQTEIEEGCPDSCLVPKCP
jgi:cobalt-zinc-cadmium efflux system protein